MTSSMHIEKPEDLHCEHLPSDSRGAPSPSNSASAKKAVVAWLTSMCMCAPIPSIRILRPRHARCRRSKTTSPDSQQYNVKTLESRILSHNISQFSLVTTSTKDCVEALPGDLIDNVKSEHTSGQSSATPGIYQSMPHDDSIRLLRVHRGVCSDPIEISLDFARLDHVAPSYEALSYVWGSSVLVSYIIDKRTQTPILVTRNLYDALKNVRQIEQDRVVWVDALCINQGDGKEKGTQVCKMNAIYTHAVRVIVWLGADEAGDAPGAFRVLCSLASTEGESTHFETRSRDSTSFVPHEVVGIRDMEAWRRVMMFFSQIWFTRLWVLQEIALAQDALFVWGDCFISWAYVGAAINSIRKNDLLRSILQTRNLDNAFLMWHLSCICRDTRASNSDQPLYQASTFPFMHILDVARGFDVTDSRDKIYGLLGFPIRREDLCVGSIMPDYSLSVAQVYTNLTFSHITKSQNLDILALVLHTPQINPECTDRINDLSSWVPNFNSKDVAGSISNINAGHQYTAGLAQPLHLSPTTNQRLLRLGGTNLDTIHSIGPSIPFTQPHKAQKDLESLIHWYTNKGATLPELAALLTCGRDRNGRLLSTCQKEACILFLTTTTQNTRLHAVTPTQRNNSNHNGNLEWRHTIHRFTTYRQPFLTATGRLGLGPRGLEEGDTIAVLSGGQCPFVLGRANNNQWVLKGECYVEAWMDRDGVAEHVRANGSECAEFEFV